MKNQNWKLLQIFADGAAGGAEGGGEGGASGGEAADAGQNERLLALGVPKDMLPKTKAKAARTPTPASRAPIQAMAAEKAGEAQTEQTEAQPGNGDTAEGAGNQPAALDWAEIVKNPDFNNRLQYMVRQRLGEEARAKDQLNALGPLLQSMAKERGVELDVSDMMKLDPEEVRTQLAHDKKYIRDGAAAMGVDEDTYADLTQAKDNLARLRKQIRDQELRDAFNKHLGGLRAQAASLREELPGLDFDTEMQNPLFRKMVGPETGMTVKQAYMALHSDEIMKQREAAAAQQSRERLSAAMRANQARPRENGAGGPVAPVPGYDYQHMSPAERQAFKERIYQAGYRGEKIPLGG